MISRTLGDPDLHWLTRWPVWVHGCLTIRCTCVESETRLRNKHVLFDCFLSKVHSELNPWDLSSGRRRGWGDGWDWQVRSILKGQPLIQTKAQVRYKQIKSWTWGIRPMLLVPQAIFNVPLPLSFHSCMSCQSQNFMMSWYCISVLLSLPLLVFYSTTPWNH